MSDGAVSLTA